MMDDDLNAAPPPAKKVTARKVTAKRAPVKRAPAKKAAPPTDTAAPAATSAAAKSAPAKRAAKKAARRTATRKPPPLKAAPAEQAPEQAPEVEQAPRLIDLTDGPTTGPIPQLTFSHNGPAEAGSEQELADHEGQDGEHDDDLHHDGDQSVGAVAAYAQSLADARTVARRRTPPPPSVTEQGSEQELADHDGQDGEHDDELHADGDHSMGAVAAYAQSLAQQRAAATSLTPPLPPAEVVTPGPPAETPVTVTTSAPSVPVIVTAADPTAPGPATVRRARERFCDLLGPDLLRTEIWPYARALDVGDGVTGAGLRQAGVLRDLEAADGAKPLPFPDGSFDLVVGDGLLGTAPDPDAALAEVLRVLRPGGRFVLTEASGSGVRFGALLERVVRLLVVRVVAARRLRERWAAPGPSSPGPRVRALTAGNLAAAVGAAGAGDVRTHSDGLLAAAFDASATGVGTAVNPERLGAGWTSFVDRAGDRLSGADRWLARFVPSRHFCTVSVTGIKRP